jgi:hypothetical protein
LGAIDKSKNTHTALGISTTTPERYKRMAIVVNKPLPEFEANATGGIKVTNTSPRARF